MPILSTLAQTVKLPDCRISNPTCFVWSWILNIARPRLLSVILSGSMLSACAGIFNKYQTFRFENLSLSSDCLLFFLSLKWNKVLH